MSTPLTPDPTDSLDRCQSVDPSVPTSSCKWTSTHRVSLRDPEVGSGVGSGGGKEESILSGFPDPPNPLESRGVPPPSGPVVSGVLSRGSDSTHHSRPKTDVFSRSSFTVRRKEMPESSGRSRQWRVGFSVRPPSSPLWFRCGCRRPVPVETDPVKDLWV